MNFGGDCGAISTFGGSGGGAVDGGGGGASVVSDGAVLTVDGGDVFVVLGVSGGTSVCVFLGGDSNMFVELVAAVVARCFRSGDAMSGSSRLGGGAVGACALLSRMAWR